MEETQQQEGKETGYKNSNDDEGGIRRRLRDRDLLRKRKAEAEEEETNQSERQRKRPRAGERGDAKRRGRPRKSEPPPETPPVSQGEGASARQGGAVPESVGVVSEQTPGPVTPSTAAGIDQAPEAQAESVLSTSAFTPEPGPVQSFVFAPLLTSPAPVYKSAGLLSASAPALPPPISAVDPNPVTVQASDPDPVPVQASDPDPVPVQAQDPDPVPVQAPDPEPVPVQAPYPVPVQAQKTDAIPVPTLSQALVPAPVSTGPPQIESVFTESQDRQTLKHVQIEDLGQDEDEEDMSESQDLTEPALNIVPDQNKMFSIPTMSSPPPQEYLPGNSY